MTAPRPVRRREFIQSATASTALFATLGNRLARTSLGAEAPSADSRAIKDTAGKVLAEMEAKGGNFLNVLRKEGQFLNLLSKATRARSILEIGTSHGYSAIWMSLALEETGGKLTTLEILPERVALAKAHLSKAGVSHRVTSLEGDAHKLVPTLDGPFDFVFFDADKDGQIDYFEKLYPKKLSPGAVIVAHSAIQRAANMKGYLEMIEKHPEFDSVIVSAIADDGFSVSYRHRA